MTRGPHRIGVGAASSGASTLSRRRDDIAALVAALPALDVAALNLCWRNHLGGTVPAHLPRWLLTRVLAFRLQAAARGDLDKATLLKLKRDSVGGETDAMASPFVPRSPATREGVELRPGALLAREWRGKLERVTALEQGFAWNGKTYGSLSQVAKAMTGTSWNGHRFFGLRPAARSSGGKTGTKTKAPAQTKRERALAAASDLEAPR